MKITNYQETLTKKQMCGKAAMRAFRIARYRVGHNRRYDKWDDDKILKYCVAKAFDAAVKQKNRGEKC